VEQEKLTEKIIGAAIEVHRQLGPGYIESAYEEALCVELTHRNINYERQKPLQVYYRGVPVCSHRLDILVEGLVVLELKAISTLEKIHFAMLRSYLKAANLNIGLLMNFASTSLDVHRIGKEYTGHKKTDLQL